MSLSESFKAILFSLFLFGCQTLSREFPSDENDPRGGFQIEDEFLPFALNFERLSRIPLSTPIYFAEGMDPLIFGLCIKWRKPGGEIVKEIKINRDLWLSHDEMQREMIIFHELGHCELNRKHTIAEIETPENKYIPISIMYPTLFSKEDYRRFHSHFAEELFQQSH